MNIHFMAFCMELLLSPLFCYVLKSTIGLVHLVLTLGALTNMYGRYSASNELGVLFLKDN